MTKRSIIALFLLFAIALTGCQQAQEKQIPTTLPTRITILPSPTPPPAPKASDGRTLPVESSEVPRMTPQELQALMTSPRNVVIIDTRSNESYATEHISGAINMFESQVQSRYQELPRNAKIVIYCA